jgi:hypothetical protein
MAAAAAAALPVEELTRPVVAVVAAVLMEEEEEMVLHNTPVSMVVQVEAQVFTMALILIQFSQILFLERGLHKQIQPMVQLLLQY